jgi:hypothetical protein
MEPPRSLKGESQPRRPPVEQEPPRTSPGAEANGYRLETGIVGRLREERRATIEATQVELVERDGRVWQLRRLPSAVTE